MSTNRSTHIRLTSHPGAQAPVRFPIRWGASDPQKRGPVIGSVANPADRNAIGTHGGSYSLYRALAVSSGALNPIQRPDLRNTSPVVEIGPHPQWSEAGRIVSLDPFGATSRAGDFRSTSSPRVSTSARRLPSQRHAPTVAELPEIERAVEKGRLKADGTVDAAKTATFPSTKAAIDPVWYLPGIAELASASARTSLRRVLFEQTGWHVSRARDAAGPRRLPAADRRHDGLSLRRSGGDAGIRRARSPAGCTTSATDRTCSAPTSAPAGPISCTASRSAVKAGAGGRRRPHRLQPQGGPGARRGDEVPRLQRPQAPGRRRPGGDLFRAHRMRRRRPGRPLSSN